MASKPAEGTSRVGLRDSNKENSGSIARARLSTEKDSLRSKDDAPRANSSLARAMGGTASSTGKTTGGSLKSPRTTVASSGSSRSPTTATSKFSSPASSAKTASTKKPTSTIRASNVSADKATSASKSTSATTSTTAKPMSAATKKALERRAAQQSSATNEDDALNKSSPQRKTPSPSKSSSRPPSTSSSPHESRKPVSDLETEKQASSTEDMEMPSSTPREESLRENNKHERTQSAVSDRSSPQKNISTRGGGGVESRPIPTSSINASYFSSTPYTNDSFSAPLIGNFRNGRYTPPQQPHLDPHNTGPVFNEADNAELATSPLPSPSRGLRPVSSGATSSFQRNSSNVVQDIERQLVSVKAQNAAFTAEFKAQILAKADEVQEKERTIKDLQQRISKLEERLDEHLTEKSNLERAQSELSNELEAAKQRSNNLEIAQKEIHDANNALLSEKNDLSERYIKVAKETAQKIEKVQELEQEVDKLRSQLEKASEFEGGFDGMVEQLRTLTQENQRLSERTNEMEGQCPGLLMDRDILRDEVDRLRNRMLDVDRNAGRMKDQLKHAVTSRDTVQIVRQEKERELNSLNRKLDTIKSEVKQNLDPEGIALLSEIVENREVEDTDSQSLFADFEEIEALIQQSSRLESEWSKLHQKFEATRNHLTKAEDEVNGMSAKISEMKERERNLMEQVKAMTEVEESSRRANVDLASKTKEVQDARARIVELEAVSKEYDQFQKDTEQVRQLFEDQTERTENEKWRVIREFNEQLEKLRESEKSLRNETKKLQCSLIEQQESGDKLFAENSYLKSRLGKERATRDQSLRAAFLMMESNAPKVFADLMRLDNLDVFNESWRGAISVCSEDRFPKSLHGLSRHISYKARTFVVESGRVQLGSQEQIFDLTVRKKLVKLVTKFCIDLVELYRTKIQPSQPTSSSESNGSRNHTLTEQQTDDSLLHVISRHIHHVGSQELKALEESTALMDMEDHQELHKLSDQMSDAKQLLDQIREFRKLTLSPTPSEETLDDSMPDLGSFRVTKDTSLELDGNSNDVISEDWVKVEEELRANTNLSFDAMNGILEDIRSLDGR